MTKKFIDASPRISVRLFKTIQRGTIAGGQPVSARYAGKDPYIDLTEFLGEGSAVRTSKSVKEPAGSFSITFADKAETDYWGMLESVYGLVEPMDVVEIRMWGGMGPSQLGLDLPIVMRGFVSDVARSQTMGSNGQPMRTVTVTGQDYGKLWQVYQIVYLPFYTSGQPLLTNFELFEMFGVGAVNTMKAGEFVSTMVDKVINPFVAGFMPDTLAGAVPRDLDTVSSISVNHGVVNMGQQQWQGSIYDILRQHSDVGIWNELYTEDREDGVHVVYRPIPAMELGTETLIMDDAQAPVYCRVTDGLIESVSYSRTDGGVANFYWVNSQLSNMVSDIARKYWGLSADDQTINIKDYPNSAAKYYGVRPMYAETNLGEDGVENLGSGQRQDAQDQRDDKMMDWVGKRRQQMLRMNRDNVVLERGVARVKGGVMRPAGYELMKPGDYAMFQTGNIQWRAYVTQIEHEFTPYQGYTQTLSFERGEGFAVRSQMNGSPYLSELATRQEV